MKKRLYFFKLTSLIIADAGLNWSSTAFSLTDAIRRMVEILFSLLELVSPLDHNGSTAISLWSDRALPVSGIGSAKLYVVGIAVAVCKLSLGALRSTFYQLICNFMGVVFRSVVVNAGLWN